MSARQASLLSCNFEGCHVQLWLAANRPNPGQITPFATLSMVHQLPKLTEAEVQQDCIYVLFPLALRYSDRGCLKQFDGLREYYPSQWKPRIPMHPTPLLLLTAGDHIKVTTVLSIWREPISCTIL